MLQSQIGQDAFVLKALANKQNGTFVDIGAGHPILINNTYALESQQGWSGVSIDFGHGKAHKCKGMTDSQYLEFWNSKRNSPLVIGNALTIDYEKLFSDNGLPEIIDYLDIDIEPPDHSLKALIRVMQGKHRFRVITFEHDAYRKTSTRDPARQLLTRLGYRYVESSKPDQEDWYILEETHE